MRKADITAALVAALIATWARARGWALWKALITIHGATGPPDASAKAERFGWRASAGELIDELLVEG